MSAWFIGFIGCMWLFPAASALLRHDWGNFLMYSGFVVAQTGMVINALH